MSRLNSTVEGGGAAVVAVGVTLGTNVNATMKARVSGLPREKPNRLSPKMSCRRGLGSVSIALLFAEGNPLGEGLLGGCRTHNLLVGCLLVKHFSLILNIGNVLNDDLSVGELGKVRVIRNDFARSMHDRYGDDLSVNPQ